MFKKILIYSLIMSSYLLHGSQENFWTDTFHKASRNYWGTFESLSGPGSSLEQTAIIRKKLPDLIKLYNIKFILDLPCGDFNWMKTIDISGCEYIGADIVKPLIESNIKKYADEHHSFVSLYQSANNT